MYSAEGEYLRHKRKSTGMSIFKIAKKLGVSGNYISLIERGERKPSEAILFKLSDFYDVNFLELLSLYKMTPSKNIIKAMGSPSLIKILSDISIDEHLTEEEKINIIEVISDEVISVLDRRRDSIGKMD